MSAIALFFYIKVIYAMFFNKPNYSTAVVSPGDIAPFVIIILLTALIIILGVYPNLLILFAQKAAFLFI